MFISILYELLLIIGFILLLPYGLYHFFRYNKYKASFLKRLGFSFPTVRAKNGGPIIWVHAVSVGECQAVSNLVKQLEREYPAACICISTITETGQAEAKRLFPNLEYHFYLPFDFSFLVARAFKKCPACMVILSEGDYWFNFLKQAHKNGAKVIVVNGKISEKSTKRLSCLSLFKNALFSPISAFCLQNELYKERYVALGIDPSKIHVTGNLKSDLFPAPITEAERTKLFQKLYIKPQDKVVVIGSTHDPEEELLLDELVPLLTKLDNVKIIIAPRHPERFSYVSSLVERYKQPNGCGSCGSWSKGSIDPDPQIIVLDAMGVLRKVYQIADIAIIAGSFTKKVGGHNILEAQCFGIPVVVGPYMHTQAELLDASLLHDAIVQVSIHEIQAIMRALLTDSARRKELSVNSLKMVSALTGSTERTMQVITSYLL